VLTIITGAIAGFVHVLSGPDHLAAVTPMAVAGRERGWVSGWTWGFGHASGVVVVAVLAVILRNLLPPVEAISAWSERIVGAALIAVGLWALRRSTQMRPTTHAHGVVSHRHLRIESGPIWLRRLGHSHASFCLGVLHGVAGSSHFFGVLPALALPSVSASFAYIAAFGAGTVAAMTGFAAVVGTAALKLPNGALPQRAMMMAAAVLAIAVGTLWLAV